jgi:hypothetical protein
VYWLLAGAAAIAGLAFNWGWLVAVGIAPLLVAVLPCVAMCALGLCMNKMGKSTSSPDAKTAPASEPAPSEPAEPRRPVVAYAVEARPVTPPQQPAPVAAVARSESVGERS